MRVPSQGDISEFWSDRFNLISLQVTRKFKNLDVYLGIENILNFRQKNPIRSFENPYSDNFDASMIWGPVMGRTAYFGIRKNFN
jgi:outer membrane receptor protein involved in Fe transport